MQGLPEAHVTHVFRVGRGQVGTVAVADFDQRAAEPGRVAGELHGGGVGQQFPLPGNGGLDQATEEQAHIADHHQGQAGKHQPATALAVG